MIASTETAAEVVRILVTKTPVAGFVRATENFPKLCGCGRKYSLQDWVALPHPRSAVWPIDEHEALEMRDCACKSTLAIQLINPETVREF
jgi:hypothetical protein